MITTLSLHSSQVAVVQCLRISRELY